MEKKLFKYTVSVEILTTDELPESYNFNLHDIADEITDGEWSGKVKLNSKEILLNKKAIEAIKEHGSSVDFFFGEDEEDLICPECGSSDVHVFFDPELSMGGESSAECRDCKHTATKSNFEQ